LLDYQRQHDQPVLLYPILSRLPVLRVRFWSVICGTDVPLNCRISAGLLLVHPNGIVIAPHVKIGPNCLMLQQITLGYGCTRPSDSR